MSAELEDCDLIVDLHGSARTRVLTWRQAAPVLRVRGDRLQRERWVRGRWTHPAPVRPALARYAATLAPLAVPVAGSPQVYPGAEAIAFAGDWWRDWAPPGPVLALAPGARHATKQWPVEHWLALERKLAEAGVPSLYLSTAAEREALGAVAAAAEHRGARWYVGPLPRVMALLSRSAHALTNDSGLMHVAAACGLRVVALFGSTVPELGFAPAGEGHTVLCRHEPCQPCTLHGRERCPLGHFRCMRAMGPDEVFAHLGSA